MHSSIQYYKYAASNKSVLIILKIIINAPTAMDDVVNKSNHQRGEKTYFNKAKWMVVETMDVGNCF